MKLKNITMIRNKIIYIGCLFIFFMEGYAQKIEPIPYNYHLYKKIDSSDVVSPFDEIEIASFVKRHKINKKGQILEIRLDDKPQYIIEHNISLLNNYFSKKVTIGLEKVTILNGYSVEYEVFYYQKDKRLTLKKISYKKGTINGVYITKDTNDNLLYKTQFTDGSGYWKDFYYESGNIKEEGKVENNCKLGEWKYYNKNGTIDSLKIYSIKDSVDVRFPHCLFNKNEPCY